jgi:branched-subunit amino acid ABC-type transport system permease component
MGEQNLRALHCHRPVILSVALAVGLTGAYATDWSLLSMYLLLIAVLTFRSRGLFGKKTALEA